MKRNYLLEKIIDIFSREQKGKLLDLGCGDGDYSSRLTELGFEVTAVDMDDKRFQYDDKILFKKCDITGGIPFPDSSFDYILFLEILEHLKNPFFVLAEINRILKKSGKLILSTPNILNIKSRLRFFTEGAFEFFRESPLDQISNPKENIYNLHIHPFRYHELEYLLWVNGFTINNILTSIHENKELAIFLPLIKLQLFLKARSSLRKKSIDYSRINRILVSKELLYGRHLIIEAGFDKKF